MSGFLLISFFRTSLCSKPLFLLFSNSFCLFVSFYLDFFFSNKKKYFFGLFRLFKPLFFSIFKMSPIIKFLVFVISDYNGIFLNCFPYFISKYTFVRLCQILQIYMYMYLSWLKRTVEPQNSHFANFTF